MRAVWVALYLALFAACANVQPTHVYGPAGSLPQLVIVNSGETNISRTVTQALLRSITTPAAEYTLDANTPIWGVAKAVRETKPVAVVALGAAAAAFAHAQFRDVPLFYGLVLQDQAADFSGSQVAGVTLELSPETEFALYRMVMPHMRKILTFYSSGHSDSMIERSRAALSKTGVELVSVAVPQGGLESALQRADLKGYDAVWLGNDTQLMRTKPFRALQSRVTDSHLPLLCSTFKQFAAEGAMMAVSVDFANVGSQLGAMVESALQGTSFAELGVRAPIGGRLVVNADVAATLGIDVPAAVHPFISELLSSR